MITRKKIETKMSTKKKQNCCVTLQLPGRSSSYILKQSAFYSQLPGGDSALSVLSIRLGRVESVGDKNTQLSLLLDKENTFKSSI